MKNVLLILTFIFLAGFSWRSMLGGKETPAWVKEVRAEVQLLEKEFEGDFGIYIKDLSDQSEFSHKASQYWYLSSTVKIPVAVALLKLVDEKKIKLNEKVTITKADYRDGAGPVNWIVPGQKVTYRYLLNKMLRYSDNAATDLIIKRVGLDAVNELVSLHTGGQGFGPITTLLDV
ncbi:MAG: class A beta-lactamase-related serine hydrolase, partial [Bdellovibrionales bacterium]|nr:class A beta-lactamase-related serine hydrolase [Bdellovibrionales bacterium]